MICYIHYYVRDPKRSDQIFRDIMKRVVDSGLIKELQEVRVVTCGRINDVVTNFEDYERTRVVASEPDRLLFEFPTLEKLYEDCLMLDDNIPILYMHLKGSSKADNKQDALWLEKMLTIVTRREECLAALKESDAVGISLYDGIVRDNKVLRHFQGNFFWSNSSYIKKLPRPRKDSLMNTHGYIVKNRQNKNPDAPINCSWRYLCEFWIGIENQGTSHRLFELKSQT